MGVRRSEVQILAKNKKIKNPYIDQSWLPGFFQTQNTGQCRTLQDIFQLLAGQSCSEMKDNAGQISKFS